LIEIVESRLQNKAHGTETQQTKRNNRKLRQKTTAMASDKRQTLRFEDGAVQFRQRIVVSLLSHKPLLIRNIRSNDLQNPGLKDYEASFLRIIDRLTNGSQMEINSTGTQLRFKPGQLLGGPIHHDCPESRSIGWFLEGILPLAPFGKEPLEMTLSGITDGLSEIDPSVDYWKRATGPLFSNFGIGTDEDEEYQPKIEILQRAAAPTTSLENAAAANANTSHYTGRVKLVCPIAKPALSSIDWTDQGKIKRIRGNAISCKIVSSSMAARVAYSAKGVFHRLLPDVWIHTDVHTPKRNRCGPNPGMSLVVTSESTTGVQLTAECCLSHHNAARSQQRPENTRGKELPEDLGTRGAYLLLEEIRRGGCIDTASQSLAFLWMALTPEDVSRIRVGTLSQYSIETLRLLKTAFDVEFKVTPDLDTKTVLMTCLGTGYRNMARAST
jgi:RNA 3'-terminal phosphate cyclase-like protein